METYMAVVAFLIAVLAAYFLILAHRGDRRLRQDRLRAALYAGIRNGDIGKPRQVVRDLASAEFFELWSIFLDTGEKADLERILARLHAEEDQLVLARRKINWAKPVSILMTILAMVALLFSASEAMTQLFPKSWGRYCPHWHACIVVTSKGSGTPGAHSDKVAAAKPTRLAPRDTFRTVPIVTRSPGEHPERRRHALDAPRPQPSVRPTVGSSAKSGCSTVTDVVPCAVGKVTKVATQCVLQPATNLVDLDMLGVNVPDLTSTTQCVTSQLLNPAPAASDGPDR